MLTNNIVSFEQQGSDYKCRVNNGIWVMSWEKGSSGYMVRIEQKYIFWAYQNSDGHDHTWFDAIWAQLFKALLA